MLVKDRSIASAANQRGDARRFAAPRVWLFVAVVLAAGFAVHVAYARLGLFLVALSVLALTAAVRERLSSHLFGQY